MLVSNTFSQWVISLAIALALLGAPLLPAMAAVPTDAAAHAVHADHGKSDKAPDVKGGKVPGCLQHDQCGGKCCTACAQCFTAAFHLSSISAETYSVQFPTVLHLDDRLTVAAHNRPPTA